MNRVDEVPRIDEPVAVRPRRPHRRGVYILVAVAVLGGFAARALLGGDAADNPLLNWLPWLHRTQVTVFFADASGDYLVPASRTLSRNAEPEALVAELLSGPAADAGLVDLVPGGTSLRSIGLSGGVLEADFAGDAGLLAAPATRDALYYTLASWPGADEVGVTVDGVALDPPTGHLLFFYDEGRDMLVAEPVVGESPRDVLDSYLAGPGDAHLIGLPPDVELLSLDYNRTSGLLSLDFTYLPSVRDFALDHPVATRRVLEGLIATLSTGFGDIDAVWLDFEGHEALGLGQCADLLRSAQTMPEVLNDERLLSRYAGT